MRPAPPAAMEPVRPAPPQIEVSGPPGLRAPAMAAQPARIDSARWLDLIAACDLRGPARELAAHAAFLGHAEGVLRLSLSPDDDHLRLPALEKALADALAAQLGGLVQLRFETGQPAEAETLHQRDARQRDARQAAAEDTFMAHPDVRRMIDQHGARVVPDSIRPFED